jgi:hypothetical protein
MKVKTCIEIIDDYFIKLMVEAVYDKNITQKQINKVHEIKQKFDAIFKKKK